MVDKTRQVDPGKLTAYERWELPNIGEQKSGQHKLTANAPQKIKPPTAQDIENIRKQAYDAGFEEGKKAGLEQGYKEGFDSGQVDGQAQGLEQGLTTGQLQINETVAQLDTFLSELVAPLSKQQSLVEEAMLNVSMAVARAVIHRELSLDSSSIQQAIHSVLNDLPKVDKGFSLKIHTKDEPFIAPILSRYDATITLKLDDSIAPGGCIIQSSNQLIDYTIEKRFQKTVQAMLTQALQGGSVQASVDVPSSIGALSDYPSDTLDADLSIQDKELTNQDDEATSDASIEPVSDTHLNQELDVEMTSIEKAKLPPQSDDESKTDHEK